MWNVTLRYVFTLIIYFEKFLRLENGVLHYGISTNTQEIAITE